MNEEPLLFTKQDAWHGGNIGIHIHVVSHDIYNVKRLFSALWSAPGISGCYLKNTVEPQCQVVQTPDSFSVNTTCYGLLTLPDTKRICCYGMMSDYGNGEYWVYIWFPMGSLGDVYDTQAYPFGSGQGYSTEWLMKFIYLLKDIAIELNQKCPFDFALVGCEPDEFTSYKSMKNQIPDDRYDGILLRENGVLVWYPPTKWEPFIT